MPALTKTDKSDNSDVISKSIAFFNRWGILILALVMLAVSVIHILPPFNADIINYDSSYQYFLTKHSLSDIIKLACRIGFCRRTTVLPFIPCFLNFGPTYSAVHF